MATAPRNLSEYFASTGQRVPSLKERSIMFERAGLGSAANYMGSTEQNNRLLSSLFGTTKASKPIINTSTGPKLPAPNANVSASSTSSPSGPLGSIFGASKNDEGMNPDQMNIFNNKLMDVLKSYQGLNTGDLQVRRNALIKAQNNRMAEITPDEMRTLSPEQQNAIRTAEANAIGTDIDATNALITKREAQYQNFGQILGAAQTFGESIAAQTRQHQQDLQQQIKDAVSISGSGAFVGIGEKEMSELEKRAGMTKGALTGMLKALKAREEQDAIDKELQREELRASIAATNRSNRGSAPGAFTTLDAMKDPLTAFLLPEKDGGLGGRRVENEVGGYTFYDNTGKAITVDEAIAKVPGAKRSDFLAGSRDAGDASYAYSKEQQAYISKLNDDIRVDPDIKDFVTVRDGLDKVRSSAKLNSGQGDLSLIFAYMKVLDPTSVVRETEYKNAAEAVGKLPALANTPRNWWSGKKLTKAGREGFIRAAESLYNQKLTQHQRALGSYRSQAAAAGIDPNLVLRDYTSANNSNVGGSGGGWNDQNDPGGLFH